MKTIRTLLLAITGLLLFHVCVAQEVSNVNFDSIAAKIKDPLSEFYYPKLLTRFMEADSTLADEHMDHLYYGSSFQDTYSPYGESKEYEKFEKAFNDKKYKKAVPLGEKALKADPVDLPLLVRMIICCRELSDSAEETRYMFMYNGLLGALYRSGTGKTCEDGVVVNKVADEYVVLSDMGLSISSQALVDDCDKMTIANPKKRQPKQVYFNITRPMGYLSSLFQKEKK